MSSKLYQFLLLLIVFASLRCSKPAYNGLIDGVINSENISGVYKNEEILSPYGSVDLWHLVKRRSKIKDDNYTVHLMIETRSIQAKLMDGDELIDQKKLRGRLTDSCFSARYQGKFVFILPFLWWGEGQQIRMSTRENSLIVDNCWNRGGMFLIMASGTNGISTSEYSRINLNDSITSSPQK